MRRALAVLAIALAASTLWGVPASADHINGTAGGHWGHGFAPWISADCGSFGGRFCQITAEAEGTWSANNYPNGFVGGSPFRQCNDEAGWIKLCWQTAEFVHSLPGCAAADACTTSWATTNQPTVHKNRVVISVCNNCGNGPNGTYTDLELRSLIRHEYGHAVGLGHTTAANSVMRALIPLGSGPVQHDRDELAFMYETLTAGEVLGPGQLTNSANRRYFLIEQPVDGHVVMYDRFVNPGRDTPIWASGHASGAGTVFTMQGDGNAVQYFGGRAICSFRTNGRWGAHLRVQSDGNLVVYHNGVAVWARSWGSVCN